MNLFIIISYNWFLCHHCKWRADCLLRPNWASGFSGWPHAWVHVHVAWRGGLQSTFKLPLAALHICFCGHIRLQQDGSQLSYVQSLLWTFMLGIFSQGVRLPSLVLMSHWKSCRTRRSRLSHVTDSLPIRYCTISYWVLHMDILPDLAQSASVLVCPCPGLWR